jgi:membrane fusion protein (multidrug efflux system)
MVRGARAAGWLDHQAQRGNGQLRAAGQQIFSIVSPDVWITANFKETQLNRMRPGQR